MLRIRDRVLLIVTHSEVHNPPTVFRFCDALRFPNATATQLLTSYPGAGPAAVDLSSSGSHLFEGSLGGINARVYRLTLS